MLKEELYSPLESDVYRTLEYSGLRRFGAVSIEEVVGLDFELDSLGYCRRIYSSSDAVYNVASPEDVYAWLVKRDSRLLFVVEDDWLDSLLKWFGKEALVQYSKTVEGYQMKFGRCRITYLPNGFVNILEGRYRTRQVCCLHSFYHMYGLPPVVDARNVRDMAQRVVDALLKYELPIELRSPGAVLQSYLVKSGVRAVATGRVPKGALDMASNCYHTNLVVAIAGGFFPKTYDYDLISAYPSFTAKLVSCDPTYGRWVQSSRYIKDAFYGFCRVTVRTYAPMTPLLCRVGLEYYLGRRYVRQVNSIGTWEGWLTKQEIDFVIEYIDDATISIEDGWWFLPKEDVRPYRGSMLSFDGKRQEAKSVGDKFGSNLLKLVGLTAQGKFLSAFPLYGKLVGGYMRNPVYAAYVTAGTRCKVGKFVLDNWGHVLHVAVDGVALDRPVEVPSTFGEFSLDSSPTGEECVIAGDGQYWRPSRQSVFQRSTLELCTDGLTYPDMREAGRFSLAQAAMWKCSFDAIGTARSAIPMRSLSRDFGVSLRSFDDRPRCCGDLLTKQFESKVRFADV